MSIQTELTRLQNAKAAIKAAIEGKGVSVPDATLLDGMASLIEGIEAGGGSGIELPTGYQLTSGTYTPNSEGVNVIHNIKIASSLPYKNPIIMFCIYREDGFKAPGSDSARYLTFFVAVNGGGGSNNDVCTAGCVLYRKNSASNTTAEGGAESINTKNYGLPDTTYQLRSNCFVRRVDQNGTLEFSTYGIVTLESGKTYRWFAILPSDAEI